MVFQPPLQTEAVWAAQAPPPAAAQDLAAMAEGVVMLMLVHILGLGHILGQGQGQGQDTGGDALPPAPPFPIRCRPSSFLPPISRPLYIIQPHLHLHIHLRLPHLPLTHTHSSPPA